MRMALKPIGAPLALAVATAGIGGAAPLAAQVAAPAPTQMLDVAIGRGRLVTLATPMSDVFVADDKIADVQVRSPTQLYIFGKGAGETTIYATAKGGHVVYSTNVRVGNNIDSIDSMLRLAMPDARVVATPMNGMILLTGTVAAPDDAAQADELVQAFVGKDVKIVSRLRTATPLQVNLQVKFAEVSRSFAKDISSNLTTRDNSGGFLFGLSTGARSPGTIGTGTNGATNYTFTKGNQAGTISLAGHLLGLDVLSAIDLGERVGQVTMLASPNLTSLSGETASFLAGGEIPIPISQGLGAVSVEYKQYGVSLSFTPTVLSDGRISLRVRPEVSQLSAAGAVQLNGTTIPALTTRRAETTVELGSGESFMIGGLLQNSHDNSIDKTPGLGDVPVLGALFRSNAFQRNESELVIVVTAYLVKPVNANQIVLPTDGYQAPDDVQRVLLGQLSGGKSGAERPHPTMAPSAGAAPAIGAAVPAVPQAPLSNPQPAGRRGGKAAAPAAPGFSN